MNAGRASALLLACALVAGCQQEPVVVAGLQRELQEKDAGPDSAEQDGDVPDAAGAGGSAGGTQTAGAAGGAGSSVAPNCEVPDWYWPTWQVVVQDHCVVTDERLLSWLEETQRLFPIQPAGEEREFEACDWSGVWFYEDPNDPARWILCPSKCTFLEDVVTRVGEQIAACRLDAGTAP